MRLYGLINRTVSVSDYVTSKIRIITEQGIGKNLEESGRLHREVTHGDYGGTGKKKKKHTQKSSARIVYVRDDIPTGHPANTSAWVG